MALTCASQFCHDYNRNRFENQLTAEREATLRYKGENGIMKKKFTVLTKDIEDQKVRPIPDRTARFLAHDDSADRFSGSYPVVSFTVCTTLCPGTKLARLWIGFWFTQKCLVKHTYIHILFDPLPMKPGRDTDSARERKRSSAEDQRAGAGNRCP